MDKEGSLSHTRWECKYHVVVCCERDCGSWSGSGASPEMRAGPSKSACKSRLQTTSSCWRQRASVVSVDGKGEARLRQVWIEETNASEPLMKCRKVSKRCQNRE
jgi:hypothetical protein